MSASVTLEAALVIPLFVFVITIFAYILILLNFQIKVNQAMYNTARTMAKTAYTYEGSEVVDMAAAGLLVIHEVGSDTIENMNIVGGVLGFQFLLSNFQDGMLDIVVNYTIKLPFDIVGRHYINCTQRIRTRAFIGVDADNEAQAGEYVYVTPYGKVYHKNLECTYLKLSIQEVNMDLVYGLRNKSGEIYRECEKCVNDRIISGMVYITDYGECYHYSINCSGLKRGLIKISIKNAEGYKPCSKCGGKDD